MPRGPHTAPAGPRQVFPGEPMIFFKRLPMPQSQRRYFSLEVVARRLSLHPQAIRFYEREGLITSVRSEGERYYAASEVERLHVIIQLRQQLGVNLAGIEVILGMRERIKKLSKQVAELGAAAPGAQETAPAITIPVREEP